MKQITFSDTGTTEFAKLSKKEQLEFFQLFQITEEEIANASEEGNLQKNPQQKNAYRFRLKDFRIYFRKTHCSLEILHIVKKNTWKDFFVRAFNKNQEKSSDNF